MIWQTCLLALTYEKPPATPIVDTRGTRTVIFPALGPLKADGSLNLKERGPVYPTLNGRVYYRTIRPSTLREGPSTIASPNYPLQ